MDSDVSESTSSNENSCDSGDENEPGERVCISKKIRLPECFCVEEEVFKEVLNPNVWKTVFSSKHRERLQRLLPVFPENDEYEKNCTLRKLCRGENFKFGIPFNQVFKKFKDGFLSTDANVICKALKHANYQEYKNQQKNYSYHLFKDILLSRKKLIDASYILPPDQAVKMQQFVARPKDVTLSERTRLRYFSVLQNLHDEVGEIETSSDDDNYPEMSHNAILRQVQKFQSQEVSLPSEVMKITKTTSFPPGFLGSGNFHNHSLNTLEVSEERYREMLLSHKERCILYSHLPELISSKIDLKSVISRCNLSKRPSSKLDAVTKKKSKLVENSDISSVSSHTHELCEPASSFNNVTVKEEVVDSVICKSDHAVPVQETEVQTDPVVVKEEQEELMKADNYNAALLPSPIVEQANHPTCFFSLVRDLFCDSMEQKLSASKLEEKVKNWQITPAAAILEWINLQDTWSDLVSSALKFLAGDLINILPETFVPFLDYKEKQQQWQWIGSGRDSDENMNDMCQQWLENKDDMSSDRLETSQGSPPPPRVTTGWTVRPTVEEEKKVYRQQECVRYQNPHKAFTFKVHGYEAVVGPVKGVYGKESGVNKAREHSLLTSDRPPFVTILSLVRDSAARLPNGEGTRADICELLKDSQYLASASDQQIHTVVSGALDRLHYEKDPCVKYDVNRKLWIYLHRHRTEEEFERIHQAQAAAAKARKSVQKNKILKFKNKEVVRTFTPAQTISTTENVALINVDVPTIITSAQTSHSTRISTNSRSQTSPKANYAPSSRINYTVHTVPTSSQSGIKCATLAIEKPVKIVDESASEAQDKSSALPPSSLSIVTSSEGKQPCLTSHASTQSTFPPTLTLPYTKARIGNLNPTQIVSVTPVQIKQCSTEPMRNHVHDVLNVDMKPSSPSFVGQPPVLQPILTHQGIEKQSTPVIPTTTTKTKVSLPGLPAALSGFQTIVIKQEPGLRTCGGVSAIPLLSIEDRGTTPNSAAPVVARLLHGSQYLSFSNIVANSGAAKPIQNFRVQSGNICQQMLSTSAIKVVHSGPISAIADGRLPVIALKHPLDPGKDENSATTSLNVCGRLLQLTNAKSVPQEADKLADESSTIESREIATAVSSANAQTIIKVTPK